MRAGGIGDLLEVIGKAESDDWEVTVNQISATVESNGTFIAEGLDLSEGQNTITASGYNPSTEEEAEDSVTITKLAAVNASYAYDDRGNMTSRTDATGTTTYTWDRFNRLSSINLPGETSHQYYYDGAGRRIKSIEDGVERRFVYDGWNVIGERREGSDDFVSYYTRGASLGGGIGGIVSVRRNGTAQIYPNGYHTGDYFYHYNHRGDIVSVTNSSGTEVAHYRYDAFGKVVEKTGIFESPYQFSTKEYDAASRLSYYGFRFYSPSEGKWLNKDPLGYSDGLNLYSYVSNNPVNAIDPWGLEWTDWLDIIPKATDYWPDSNLAAFADVFGGTLEISAAAGLGIIAVGGTFTGNIPIAYPAAIAAPAVLFDAIGRIEAGTKAFCE